MDQNENNLKDTISIPPKIIKNLKEKYRENIIHEMNHGKETFVNLKKVVEKNIDEKSKNYSKSLKENSEKLKQNSLEAKKSIQKHSPKFFKRLTNGFFGFFEYLIGSIKIGTQYGSSSLETLEKMAKLKELGIISDKEFLEIKKKILKRI